MGRTLNKGNYEIIIPPLIVPTITLWLLESPIKYLLFFFQVLLILILYWSLSGSFGKRRFRLEGKIATLDCFFLALSLTQSTLILLKLNIILNLIPAIITSFFLPGYVILRMLKFHSFHSWIEWVVLAFALSIGPTSLIFSAMLPFTTHRATVMSAIYVCMSLFLILKDLVDKFYEKPRDCITSHLSEALPLLWISLLFLYIISSLYPQMGLRGGGDNSAHISYTKLLAFAPDVYTSYYPFFHLTWASVYELSTPPIGVFQNGLTFLTIIVLFSFYIMVNAYLKNIEHSAILATAFFSAFAGFGWVNFLGAKLNTPDPSKQLDLLLVSRDASYWDVEVGQSFALWFQFRPVTIGYTLFFVLLYLLSRNDIPKRTFMTIFSFLVLTLSFIHPPEFMFFSAFLFVLAFFTYRMPNLRLKDASLASLIGSVIYLSFGWASGAVRVLGDVALTPFQMYSNEMIILAIISLVTCILTHRFRRQLPIPLWANHQIRLFEVFICAIAAASITALLTWISSSNAFPYGVTTIQYIPLMIYPVLLGIVGFLAIHGFTVIAKRHIRGPAIVFILLFLATFMFSKLSIRVIPLYGEKRWVTMLFSSACVMASVSLVEIWSVFRRHKNKIMLATILSLVVTSGITSTYLAVEHWKLITDLPGTVMSNYELEAVEYMSSSSNGDPRSPIATALARTRNVARFIPTPRLIDVVRYAMWESRCPEVPLLILCDDRYSPPYIFLGREDFVVISDQYAEGYLARHLLNLLPVTYTNPDITVFRLPNSPPSPNSKVLLVLPGDESDDYLPVYDVLSFGNYEYGVSLSSDIETIRNGEVIIIPKDDDAFLKLLENLALSAEPGQINRQIVVFNVKGYGPLVKNFFEFEDEIAPLGYDFENWISFPSSAVVETELETGKIWNYWPGASSPLIEVKPDSGLTIKVKVRQEMVRGSSPSNILIFSGERRLSGWTFPVGTFDWKELDEKITVPSNVSDIRIQLNGGSGAKGLSAKTWFDDLRIYQNGDLIYQNTFDVREGEKIRATRLKGSEVTVDLLTEVDAPFLIEKENVTVLARYTDGQKETPLAVESVRDGVRLVYMNVYPIISAEPDTIEGLDLIEELGKAIKVAGLTFPSHNKSGKWMFEGDTAFFRDASLEGNVVINASSFMDFQIEKPVGIKIINERQTNVTSVSGLYIGGTGYIQIDASKVEIHQGKGFYSRMKIVDAILHLSGEKSLIKLMRNGETLEIDLRNGKAIIHGELTVLARAPSFKVEGESEFREIYTLSSLYPKLWSDGQNLNIQGSVQFQFIASDTYTFVRGFNWKGVTTRQPPILSWNEYDSIKNMLPTFIASFAPIIFVYTSLFLKETKKAVPIHKSPKS